MKIVTFFLACFLTAAVLELLSQHTLMAADLDGPTVTVSPAVIAVGRTGITGAGFAVASRDGQRVTLHFPTHADDFGKSVGTGTAVSHDGGNSWSAGRDDWPLPKSVGVWQERVQDGRFVALGIHWLPDPAKRRQLESLEIPASPWRIATSENGEQWQSFDARVKTPAEVGVVARPLPHIFEDDAGAWLMPAYSWSRTGNRAVLLKSDDDGRNWSFHATIVNATTIIKSGVPVTTPWLESMVVRTKDGSLLAEIRTGSSADASLVFARSSDGGLTWTDPEKVVAGPRREPVTGKLPNVLLLPNGTLALLTAHTKRGCFLYLSSDGTGREWDEGHIITTSSGSNTSMVALTDNRLLVFTPANGRINCWRVKVEL
jgi:hypothetical protein